MSASITIEQDGSTQHIDAADRFAAIVALLEKGSFLSRTIFPDGSATEPGRNHPRGKPLRRTRRMEALVSRSSITIAAPIACSA